jgi:hypothetical protein
MKLKGGDRARGLLSSIPSEDVGKRKAKSGFSQVSQRPVSSKSFSLYQSARLSGDKRADPPLSTESSADDSKKAAVMKHVNPSAVKKHVSPSAPDWKSRKRKIISDSVLDKDFLDVLDKDFLDVENKSYGVDILSTSNASSGVPGEDLRKTLRCPAGSGKTSQLATSDDVGGKKFSSSSDWLLNCIDPIIENDFSSSCSWAGFVMKDDTRAQSCSPILLNAPVFDDHCYVGD